MLFHFVTLWVRDSAISQNHETENAIFLKILIFESRSLIVYLVVNFFLWFNPRQASQ